MYLRLVLSYCYTLIEEVAMQPLRGFRDITAPDTLLWRYIEQILIDLSCQYGYDEVRLPLLEDLSLFQRSVGEHTDIVGKEMYQFNDANEQAIALRPEGTAGAVRAMINNGICSRLVAKWWYLGPMFRRERPQKGRYRQFTQFGIEYFGISDIASDIELLNLSYLALRKLKLEQHVSLSINYLPGKENKSAYTKKLVNYLEGHIDLLDDDSKNRIQTNPLRIFDSKDASTQAVLKNAPPLSGALTEEELAIISYLKTQLNELGIKFTWDEGLVRGLDYYQGVVFEWTTDHLGAQGTVCGGGRYDRLSEILGAKPWPATGLSFGIDRLVLLMNELGITPPTAERAMVIAPSNLSTRAQNIQSQLIQHFEQTFMLCHQFSSTKKSIQRAQKQSIRFVVILDESGQHLTIKDLISNQSTEISTNDIDKLPTKLHDCFDPKGVSDE
mgnify:CR=1 FL=1